MAIIDDSGFQKESYEDWLIKVQQLVIIEDGPEADLTPTGPWGQIISVGSRLGSTSDDVAEESYLARDPDNATGAAATKLAGQTGTYRIPATFTQVDNGLLRGNEGTVVPVSSEVTQGPDHLPPENLRFLLTETVTITKSVCRRIIVEADENSGAGFTYSITLDTILYTFTTGGGEDQETAIDDIISQLPVAYTGTKVDNKTLRVDSVDDMSALWSGTFTLLELWSPGDFISNLTGPLSVPIGSLDTIITSVSGWKEITNPVAGVSGANEETDQALLLRRRRELIKGKATESAMKTELAKVDNVSSVEVVSNRTNATVDGQNKKSVESIFAGGDNDDIAQAIYGNIAAGMEWFGRGGFSGIATDPSDGQTFVVPFSRPTEKYVHVRFTRIDNTEQALPSDYVVQIKTATAVFGASRYKLGDDIIKTELAIPFYAVQGSILTKTEYALTVLPGDTPTWLETDTLSVGSSEIGIFNESRVTVQDAP